MNIVCAPSSPVFFERLSSTESATGAGPRCTRRALRDDEKGAVAMFSVDLEHHYELCDVLRRFLNNHCLRIYQLRSVSSFQKVLSFIRNSESSKLRVDNI